MSQICERGAVFSRLTFYASSVSRETNLKSRNRNGGGVRAPIVEFTKRARMNMLKTISQCRHAPQWFVHLTFGADAPTPREAKERFRRFADWLLRTHKASNARALLMWRMELQKRGAPHFHVILWTTLKDARPVLLPLRLLRYVEHVSFTEGRKGWGDVLEDQRAPKGWRAWLEMLSLQWSHYGQGTAPACGGENLVQWRDALNRGVELKKIQDHKQAFAYASKYAAKADAGGFWVDADGVILEVGRLWGMKGDKSLADFRPLRSVDVAPHVADKVMAALADKTGSDYAIQQAEDGALNWTLFIREAQLEQAAMDLDALLG